MRRRQSQRSDRATAGETDHARARVYVSAPAEVEPTVMWLGYLGRTHSSLSAARETSMDAQWTVPNADPAGQNFEHKTELWELLQCGGRFQVAKLIDERSDVALLVRVDLGNTTEGRMVDRAIRVVLLSMRHTLMTIGASIAAAAIDEHGPGIASALAREELPRLLAAALQVQTTADHPFSRDMMLLRRPSEADISSVVPLADRVVQHVAANASLAPDRLVGLLGERWPHGRWLNDLQRAVQMCISGGGSQVELHIELNREHYASSSSHP